MLHTLKLTIVLICKNQYFPTLKTKLQYKVKWSQYNIKCLIFAFKQEFQQKSLFTTKSWEFYSENRQKLTFCDLVVILPDPQFYKSQ